MLSPETSKRRSARISLDHFRPIDRLAWLKFWLSASASALSIAWIGGVSLDFRQWPRRVERARELATHGPLTAAHSGLESACDACHVPFTPMDSTSWSALLVVDSKASDARCRDCHQSGGHQATAKTDDVASCASCHRDHRGRDVSLVAMPDADCTRCHSATDQHMRPGTRPAFATSVTRFDGERSHHPEFALFRDGPARDPGRLKFNHALHMSPGFNAETGGRPIKTFADLPDADREDYRATGQADGDGVQLRCDSCHQVEADRRTSPGGSAGAYMRPIRFEKDCRACHSLDFDPDLPPIRHGMQPASVSESLWQTYAARYVRGGMGTAEPGVSDRPVPGREARPQARGAIAEDVARAERVLSGEKRCGECHSFEGGDGRPVEILSAGARVVRPNIPDHWFRHATFDHSKHRTARCQDCHAGAYPESPGASRSSADVLIPTIAVCQSCHVPNTPSPSRAGNGCVECHCYHNGEDSKPGAGLVASRGPRETASTDDVLRWIMGGDARKAGRP